MLDQKDAAYFLIDAHDTSFLEGPTVLWPCKYNNMVVVPKCVNNFVRVLMHQSVQMT
jgi:hypothetical protein